MKRNYPHSRNDQLRKSKTVAFARYFFACLLICINLPAPSQTVPISSVNDPQIQGIVLDAHGAPVSGANVHIKREGHQGVEDKLTDSQGKFTFSTGDHTNYSITAEKSGVHSSQIMLSRLPSKAEKSITLVLDVAASSTKTSIEAVQFADQPNFTVAGVTDFTAAGGHGSDSSLRTSEALARATSNLKPVVTPGASQHIIPSSDSEAQLKTALAATPNNFEANHRLGEFYLHESRNADAIPFLQAAYRINKGNRENETDLALACKAIGDPAHSRKYVQDLLASHDDADLYRLAGELDESLGDSLAAVREYQKAVTLNPSEQNFFSWGSELLLHRAIWQARQVFEEGVKQYPASSRMLTGLGTALFAGAAYGDAANRLCQASDLNTLDQEPYLFLGKVQIAAPDRLPCIQEKLERFVQQQPGSAAANYFFAMALQKAKSNSAEIDSSRRTEAYLQKAIAIDPKFAEAYLQLGILNVSQRKYDQAIDFYTKAIAVDPNLTDAYYRLAVAYDRTGQSAKAKEEFTLHADVAKKQAAEIERQRLEVKQFLVVLSPDAAHATTP